jgi:hypothetical protein
LVGRKGSRVVPSGKVEAERLSVGLSVRASSGREVEQDGSSGELQRLESSLAIDKVEGSHDESGLLLLVSLGPRFAQEIPFGLELVTDGASESGLESSEEDGNRVVAGRRGQFGVFIVVELEGSCGCQLLRSVVAELVGGALLCGQSCEWQQEGCHGLEELHVWIDQRAIGTTDNTNRQTVELLPQLT